MQRRPVSSVAAYICQKRPASAFKRSMSKFRVIEHTVRAQHIRERPGAVDPRHAHGLQLAVKQYIPKSNPSPAPGDLTIIGAHANAFPKEMYEPLWEELVESMGSLGRRIRSIWIMDVAQQGQSGVLNEQILGNDPSWWDHARDLLVMINHFQDQIPPPIVGIGHSMGGMQLTQLALMHPSVFQALVLVDPVIQRENPSKPYAQASTYRRDLWSSRAEAAHKFRSSKFFQQWDPRVLEKWIEFGLRDLPTELYPDASVGKAVTLTTTKAQEVFTFLRPAYQDNAWSDNSIHDEMDSRDIDEYPFYRPEPPQIFQRLPEVKPSVLYIFGSKSDLSSAEARRDKLQTTGTGVGGSGGASEGFVKEAVLDCGHLVPMERAKQCATVAAPFLNDELFRWHARNQKLQKDWETIPRNSRNSINDKWKENIGTPSKAKEKRLPDTKI